jgi:hypothetical protein
VTGGCWTAASVIHQHLSPCPPQGAERLRRRCSLRGTGPVPPCPSSPPCPPWRLLSPLLGHGRWQQVRVIASERPTCCLAPSTPCARLPRPRTTMASPWGRVVGVDPSRPVGKGNPPRQKRRAIPPPGPVGWRSSDASPRPSCGSPSACRWCRSWKMLVRTGGSTTARR